MGSGGIRSNESGALWKKPSDDSLSVCTLVFLITFSSLDKI